MNARPAKDPGAEKALETLRQAEAMKQVEQDTATKAARLARRLNVKREGKK